MNAATIAELTDLIREGILWAKVLSALFAAIGLPLLLWALDTSRQLYAVKSWQERHDDTLHDLKETRSSFAGVFRSLRKLELRLLELAHRRRPS